MPAARAGHTGAVREHQVTLPDGPTLAVLSAGGPEDPAVDPAVAPGARPRLLLVHGFTGAKEDFAPHVPALAARGWWVVAPDLPGHGASPVDDGEDAFSLARFARDVATLVDVLGWDRHVLLGHSMGGMVAQLVALADPGRLHGLVLMDTGHGPVTGVDPGLAELGAALARDGGMAAVKEALDGLGDDAPLGSPAYEALIEADPGHKDYGDANLLAASPAMYAAMLTELLRQEDRLEALAGLDVPTMVLVGDQDEPFLGPSERLAGAIAGARHAVVPDAGHSPQFENPPAWLEAVIAFLDELA